MAPLSPYSYDLPDDRIAQRPVHPPEAAKMLVVDRATRLLRHSVFSDITNFLKSSDHLVFNDTKVIPARLFGRLENESGYEIEVVLLEEKAPHEWTALGFPMRKIRQSSRIYCNDKLSAEVLTSPVEDRLLLRFQSPDSSEINARLLEHGTMPIPPYIREGRGDEQDRIDYQSIFAQCPGSVAAPTASLHFSKTLMEKIRNEARCRIDTLTLHVSTASFQPIFVNGELRPPGTERYSVPEALIQSLLATKQSGGRVVAVGTTVVRALESAARSMQESSKGETALFIQPGFEFKLVDALITNFHQPRTTHLLLVEALLEKELLRNVYETALNTSYRFLSYGDGMFIV